MELWNDTAGHGEERNTHILLTEEGRNSCGRNIRTGERKGTDKTIRQRRKMIRDNIIKDKEYKGKIDVILEGIE